MKRKYCDVCYHSLGFECAGCCNAWRAPSERSAATPPSQWYSEDTATLTSEMRGQLQKQNAGFLSKKQKVRKFFQATPQSISTAGCQMLWREGHQPSWLPNFFFSWNLEKVDYHLVFLNKQSKSLIVPCNQSEQNQITTRSCRSCLWILTNNSSSRLQTNAAIGRWH